MRSIRRLAVSIATVVALAACQISSGPTASPAGPSDGAPGQGAHPQANAQPAIDLATIIVSPEAPPAGMRHDELGAGRDALTMLIISGREAEYAALDGFVGARWTTFSGEIGTLLSLAMVFDSSLSGDLAFHRFEHELSTADGYNFGTREPADLGFEGSCDAGPNPALDGVVESICLWRTGSLILVAGGAWSMAEVRAVADAMDTRAVAAATIR